MKTVKESNRDKLIYWLDDFLNDKGLYFDRHSIHFTYSHKNLSTIKEKNQYLFEKFYQWIQANHIEYKINVIQFGIKLKTLGKNIQAKTGEVGIVKDTHSNNTIYCDAAS